MSFAHTALELAKDKKVVFTAFSKTHFYFRMHISAFALQQGVVPLNPFMSFDYFLLDAVERDLVRSANNTLVHKADELWVFGDISNGVFAEVQMAKVAGMPISYFKIIDAERIEPCSLQELKLEEDVKAFAQELYNE